jgi:alpha-galactosidase
MDLVLDYCELKTGKGVFSAIPDFSTGEACMSGEWGELRIRHSDGLVEPVLKPAPGLRLESISLHGLLRTEVHPDNVVFLKEGFQSWSYSGALGRNDAQKKPLAKFVVANQENTSNPPTNRKGHHVSDMYFFAGDRDSGQGLLVGQLAPFDQYLECSFTYGDYAHKVNLRWDMQCTPGSEREIALDKVLIARGEVNSLLVAYAERIARDKNVNFHRTLRAGWCSWYYYYTNISADCILQNLDYSKKHNIAFDFFQIDVGYQSTIGDWLILRDSFKVRMPGITGRIKEAVYTPGLWLAPFIISKKSVHFNKPGWVLRNEKGKPVVAGLNPAWGGYYYALDITHPEVQEYVRRVFRTMIDEWGFTYLKLDFMYAASMPGVRYDKTLSRAQVMKLGNALIRDTVGPDVILLGCGMPIARPSVMWTR